MNSFSISPEGAFTLTPDPATAPAPARERATPLITQYWMIAIRRRWTIIGAIALCVLAAILFSLLATPRYTAITQLEISREGARILNNVQNVQPETNSADQEFYQTQYTILNSRSLADRVARDLKLADNAHFFSVLKNKPIMASFAAGGASCRAPIGRARRRRCCCPSSTSSRSALHDWST